MCLGFLHTIPDSVVEDLKTRTFCNDRYKSAISIVNFDGCGHTVNMIYELIWCRLLSMYIANVYVFLRTIITLCFHYLLELFYVCVAVCTCTHRHLVLLEEFVMEIIIHALR